MTHKLGHSATNSSTNRKELGRMRKSPRFSRFVPVRLSLANMSFIAETSEMMGRNGGFEIRKSIMVPQRTVNDPTAL